MNTNPANRARKMTVVAISATLLALGFVTVVAAPAAAIYVHFGAECEGFPDCHVWACEGDTGLPLIACDEHE